MADQLSVNKVMCRGGLDTSRDVLAQGEQSPGSAIQMVNYEAAVTGGYRRISGFANSYGTVTGTGATLGVNVAHGINDGILACRTPSSGNNYLHRWNNSTSAWVAVTCGGSPTMTGVSKVRFSNFNFATPKTILTDGINPAATYDGTTYTQITHSAAPTDPKFAVDYANHMFLAGDPAHPTKLFFSAPLAETDFATSNGAGVISVGFDIVAIKPFRDVLYIFGTNAIKSLKGTSTSDFVLSGVTHDLGCLASDSIIEIGGDLLFLSQDGMRPISGTNRIGDVELETISKNIQSLFTDIVFNIDLNGLSSVVIRKKSQFRIFFSAAESQGIIGGIRAQQEGFAFEFGQILGIEATCASSGYLGQYEFVIHGTSDGKVHRQEIGNSFNGVDIFSLYQTPYLYMDNPEQRKIMHKVSTYLRSEGDNELILSVVYDYEDINVMNPANYTMTTKGAAAYFNEATYDSTAIFSGNPSPIQTTNISGSGKSVSFKYVTNGTDASHSIQGLVLTYGTGDLR
jgi:hypothetical protein|tara:strand:- start:25 stop:1563 length:1539 start_codon:yes stop_codon:yes gene_type:complete